jgi:hypothetical protein
MARQRSYSIHCVAALIVIAIPLMAGWIREDDDPHLTGFVIAKEKPVFSLKTWFDGSYQKLRDDYSSDHWAFKEKMVRANNQLYYDAFNQIRVKSFVAGKDHYVFSESYVFSAFGDDLMDEGKVASLLEKAKVVQDTLKRKGIDLLFVYAPGKGVACREFIEDKYVHPYRLTNHDLFVKHGKRLGINTLDLYAWFEKLKGISPHPLFTRFGHHWSYYGECLASDTIIHHIENLHGSDMPDIAWEQIDVVDTARSRDADILKSMNLMKDPPVGQMLAYPQVQFEDADAKNTTRVLTLSDSYWYGPVYLGIPTYCFAGGQFWYYYNKVIPSPRQGEKVEVWQLDLKQEVEGNDVIMLLYSDGNLPGFGNGFIQDVYEMYTDPAKFAARSERNRQINTYAKQIRESPILLKQSTKLSDDLQIPLDSAIRLDAMKRAGLLPR